MGMYLVGVGEDDWAEDDLLLGAAPLLDKALKDRGLPAYAGPPRQMPVPAGADELFEEKLYRPMGTFGALLRRHFPSTPHEVASWDMLVPVEFDGLIELETPSAYESTTLAASSARVLEAIKTLATAIDLAVDQVPASSNNLDIGIWIDEVEAGNVDAAPGAWRDDYDAAYYVAIYLRGAEFSLRRNCPMRYV